MLTYEEIKKAQNIIYKYMLPSPQMQWPLIDKILQAKTVIKHENVNPTGAFKVRGGLVFMEELSKNKDIKGIISATRGNHGQSLAFAGTQLNIPVTIVVPHNNSDEKNAAIKAMNATLIEYGNDFEEARIYAKEQAEKTGFIPVPPFDKSLIQGVATYHYELLSAHPDIEAYYLPIGMGSGICSAIMVRDLLGLKTKIYGVSAKGAPAMYNSFKAGKIICGQSVDTLADGIAVRTPLPDAFNIIKNGAEDVLLVDDDDIKQAINIAWKSTHQLLEGAGAASLAGALQHKNQNKGKKISVTFSGANIDKDLFMKWLS